MGVDTAADAIAEAGGAGARAQEKMHPTNRSGERRERSKSLYLLRPPISTVSSNRSAAYRRRFRFVFPQADERDFFAGRAFVCATRPSRRRLWYWKRGASGSTAIARAPARAKWLPTDDWRQSVACLRGAHATIR